MLSEPFYEPSLWLIPLKLRKAYIHSTVFDAYAAGRCTRCVNKFIHHMYIMGSPRTSRVSGESGGIGRLNVDRVNSQCDPIAERECQKPNQCVQPFGWFQ